MFLSVEYSVAHTHTPGAPPPFSSELFGGVCTRRVCHGVNRRVFVIKEKDEFHLNVLVIVWMYQFQQIYMKVSHVKTQSKVSTQDPPVRQGKQISSSWSHKEGPLCWNAIPAATTAARPAFTPFVSRANAAKASPVGPWEPSSRARNGTLLVAAS